LLLQFGFLVTLLVGSLDLFLTLGLSLFTQLAEMAITISFLPFEELLLVSLFFLGGL